MPAWASTCMPTNPRTACQATLASRSGLESKDLSVPQSSVPCVGGGARHDDTHRKRNDHPASAGARRLGVYGLSVVEPDPRHMSTFSPSWYNAWEAKTYVQACKN